MEQRLTLSELNERIKNALLDAFPATVWVIGEISELKENRSGHCYLELIEKEKDNIVARNRATIWSYTYRMLKPYFETTTGQPFIQGIKILVQASVEYHPAYGLSLNIRDIDPVYTLGDLALQRKEIIARLQQEGVFDMNRELELPLVPQRIAVISSKTAAGFQDFIHQLKNNEYGFVFYTRLFEAYMQGSEAAPSIIDALDRIFLMTDLFDVVVIIRGGGATADLSCFDNYELALHITQFPLPVITGIGHEKDDTIADMVAHTRMKTPTAVAEFIVSGAARFYERLLELEHELVHKAREILYVQSGQIENSVKRLDVSVSGFLAVKNNQLTRTGNSLQQKVNRFVFGRNTVLIRYRHRLGSIIQIRNNDRKNTLQAKSNRLKQLTSHTLKKKSAWQHSLKTRLGSGLSRYLSELQKRLKMNENLTRILSPENTLKRGYTLTMKEGKIVKSAGQLRKDDRVHIRFTDGTSESIILNIKTDDSKENHVQ